MIPATAAMRLRRDLLKLTDPLPGLAFLPPALAPSAQPDQLRRVERYRFAGWLQREGLDIEPQLKGRLTLR